MAQKFKETAHLHTDMNKYSEGWDRIFNKKALEESNEEIDAESIHEKIIKSKAMDAYRDQRSQDTEGGCKGEGECYVRGYIEGYKTGLKNV